MSEKNINNLKNKKEGNMAKSQLMKDLQEVTSILEKLEKLTTNEEKSPGNVISKNPEELVENEHDFPTDQLNESFFEEIDQLSPNILDSIIQKIEELLIIQLKDSIIRMIEILVNDQVKVSFKVLLVQKNDIWVLLLFYYSS